MHRLENHRRRYDWGSPVAIPDFLGETSDGDPVAEEWMGTHALGESHVGGTPLSQVAGRLPFMFKLLAAERPLSIQVHPSPEIAREGFAAEEALGVAIDDPRRTFKDPHHKPEMVYALTTFDTLVGFRPTAEILRVLHGLDLPLSRRLAEELTDDPGYAGIVRLVARVLESPADPAEVEALVTRCRELVEQGIDVKRAYLTVVEISQHHPGDLGLIVSLALNRLTLQPGEAAFLDDGIIHAHLRGLCLEVMAASDNVVRGGLTSKPLDPHSLIDCLAVGMSRLARVTPRPFGLATEVFAPDVAEFALAVGQCATSDPDGTLLPTSDHRIVVCTGGTVELVAESGERLMLDRGDSVYAGADAGDLRIVGLGEVAQAFLPGPDLHGRLVDLV